MDASTKGEKLVFFVIGSTGSRKSATAVEIAHVLQDSFEFQNVVILNCDVSQFYEDLPIGTNKAVKNELGGVPHLFLGFLDGDGVPKYSPESCYPHTENHRILRRDGQKKYKIKDYQTDVVRKIEEHFSKHRKTAIILCGGTCYYSQAVLFTNTLAESSEENSVEDEYVELEPSDLWSQLNKIDPVIAIRYHPHDTRRIQRLLAIHKEEGRVPSEIFSEKSVSLRYEKSYVLWTAVEKGTLQSLLSVRLEEMVKRGLLKEVSDFYEEKGKHHPSGSVAESIGYKEFLPCVTHLGDLSDSSVQEALRTVKANTWRYARQQVQFIQNRFIPLMQSRMRNKWEFVKMDTTCQETIHDTVVMYLENILVGSSQGNLRFISFPDGSQNEKREAVEQEMCPVCKVIIYGRGQMAVHLQSKRHRGGLKRERLEKEQWEKYGRVIPPKKQRRRN